MSRLNLERVRQAQVAVRLAGRRTALTIFTPAEVIAALHLIRNGILNHADEACLSVTCPNCSRHFLCEGIILEGGVDVI